MSTEETVSGDVLELRVHGVNNTPPAALLDLPEDKIERVLGDNVAGFWRAKAGATATLRPGDRGYTPPFVTREAYSWGGLARTSLGGGEGTLSRIVGIVARFGWMLLLPFGLANLAYWTRRLSAPADASDTSSGRGLVRLFALGLTLLGVSTAAELTLNIVATQCYATGQGSACSNRLSFLGDVFTRPQGERLVIAAAGPMLFLLLLWFLSARTSAKYERARSPQVFPDQSGTPDSVLTKPRFWARDQLVEGLSRVHLAAGIALIALLLCLTAGSATSGAARTVAQLAGGGSLVVLAACCISAVIAPARDRPPATTSLLVVAVIVLGGAGLSVWRLEPADSQLELAWAHWLPVVLVVALFALLCTAFWLRTVSNSLMVAVISLVGLAVVVGAGLVGPGHGWRDLLLLTPPVLFIVALYWRVWKRRDVAFGGTAPGVFLAIAFYVALLESSLVLLGIGNWLNGSKDGAAALATTPNDSGLTVALPYVLFASASAVVSVLFVLLLVVVGALHLVIRRTKLPDANDDPNGPLTARRLAALAHRPEKAVLALAILEVVALYVVVIFAAADKLPSSVWPEQQPALRRLSDAGFVLLAFAAVAISGALVGASGRTRPLGLLWDLLCFLPRAAHPFAPPCYAERVVPELAGRVEEWLDQHPDDEVIETDLRRGRAVVLSAHSLGAVLAVAVLLGRPRLLNGQRPPVLLLTYGSQLRAYFGRILPELLGPHVLGTTRVRAASLWRPDPWIKADLDRTAPMSPLELRLRTPDGKLAWRSLWRRTDYLGFPVNGYKGNPIDRPAAEEDRSGYLVEIGTHSNYPRVRQYNDALEALVAMAPEAPRRTRPALLVRLGRRLLGQQRHRRQGA